MFPVNPFLRLSCDCRGARRGSIAFSMHSSFPHARDHRATLKGFAALP